MSMGIGIGNSSITRTGNYSSNRPGNCTITKKKQFNSVKTKIEIKRPDGSTAATISITSPDKNKKKKRLSYNFKKISNQIMMSKNSNSAGRAVTIARSMVAMLQKKLKSGDYDDTELEKAIVHAKKMERIAKKRMKNMQQEERAEQNSSSPYDIEDEITDMEESFEEESAGLSEKELEEMIQELQEFVESFQEEMLQELTDEFIGGVPEDMSPEDLERLKKKHRSDEYQEIVKADMAYLKALFNKLEKERQENTSGVSLELSGMDIPIEAPMEAPVMTEGGSVDISV